MSSINDLLYGNRYVRGWVYLCLNILLVFVLCSCSPSPYRFPLICTPAVFWDSDLDPFGEKTDVGRGTDKEVFYATDRRPAGEDDNEPFYTKDRGHSLRLGKATVRIGDEKMDWPDIQNQSFSKVRDGKLWVQVKEVREFGKLLSTQNWYGPEPETQKPHEPSIRFAEEINEKLHYSKQKDIFIFVHGYRMVFEYPVLVASEFWHYLGYDGVFLAYAWPSTPKFFAYMSDVETAELSTRNFRLLLTYLSQKTNVRRIHIMCFSAGSRVVSRALKELRLINYGEPEDSLHRRLKIGQLIFTGADMDLEIFKAYHADGINDVPEQTTIYISEKDKSLKMAETIFGRTRLGTVGGLSQSDMDYLAKRTDISFIDVSYAKDSDAERGHDYFRRSPWVSSDVLLTLKYQAEPDKRGLVRTEDDPIWKFPSDYVHTVKDAVTRLRFKSRRVEE